MCQFVKAAAVVLRVGRLGRGLLDILGYLDHFSLSDAFLGQVGGEGWKINRTKFL